MELALVVGGTMAVIDVGVVLIGPPPTPPPRAERAAAAALEGEVWGWKVGWKFGWWGPVVGVKKGG